MINWRMRKSGMINNLVKLFLKYIKNSQKKVFLLDYEHDIETNYLN